LRGLYLSLNLFFAGAQHQLFDGFARIFALIQDQFHLLGDGHFNAVLPGESKCGARGKNTLRNFAAQTVKNLSQLAALAQSLADGAVAGERSGAGKNQIADAGESGEGFTASTTSYRQSSNLGDPAGDKSSGGVIAQANPGGDSGSNGNDVLQCAAEFDANQVCRSIESETLAGEFVLNAAGNFWIVKGDGKRGRLALS